MAAAGTGEGSALPDFCAADAQFKPGAAEGFKRYAQKCLKYPPRNKLQDILELRGDDKLGVHAAARCDIEIGALILSEEPILKVPDAAPESKQRLRRSFGDRSAFLSPAVGMQWDAVDEETFRDMMKTFFVHPLMEQMESPQVQTNLQACKEIIAQHEPLKRKSIDPMDLLRFLHIVDLNIHRDDEVPESAAFTGIFVFGSKFSHSCAPNCAWSFSREGRLQYHAVRPIAKGDLLTFSYIGTGMNLLCSTLERRRRLAGLWFICQCSRCLGPDLARRMRCPKCGAAGGCLPEYPEAPFSPTDPDSERISPNNIWEAKTWKCTSCSARSLHSDMPCHDESDLIRLVPEAMMKGGPPGAAAGEARLFLQLKQRAEKTVGPHHWTYALAGFAWLQRSLVRLRNDPFIEHSEAEFQRVSKDVAKWLETAAPDNVEQRLSALFASVRLEHNLGGGLAAWGYDPADPLGGGYRSLERLRDHGWRLSIDGAVIGPEVEEQNERAAASSGRRRGRQTEQDALGTAGTRPW